MSCRMSRFIGAMLMAITMSVVIMGLMAYDTVKVIAAETKSSDRSKTIYELENKLKSAEKEEAALKAAIASDKAQAAGYEREIQTLDSEISVLTQRITIIEELNGQWQAMADETKAEIERLEIQKEDEIQAFEGMLRMSYLHGTDTYFNLIFGSQDIGDFLSRTDLISYHLQANDNIVNNLTTTISSLESAKTQYEESITKLGSYSQEQEKLQAELEERSKYASKRKSELLADAEAKEGLLSSKEKEMAEMEAEIKKLHEEQKKNDKSSSSTYTGGPFAMPLPKGTYRVSSGFVNRISPITGKAEKHNGLDLAAPAGTPIYAAADGTVIDSRYSSSWGNVVQIDHGGGIVTLYAHCSARLVSKGATVKKGETIAKVGSTGWSTGNHLHFTVYKNGTAVNPRGADYLNF